MKTLGAVLVFFPVAVAWVLLLRLAPYRRDGRGVLGTVFQWQLHALRPDLYVDAGQHLVRWLWVVAVLTIPWIVVVVLVFLR